MKDLLEGQVSPWDSLIGHISECGQTNDKRRFSLGVFYKIQENGVKEASAKLMKTV
jgi:hypothetical protein